MQRKTVDIFHSRNMLTVDLFRRSEMKNTIFLFLGLFLLGGPIVQAEEALPETPSAAEETAEEFEDDDPVMDIVTTDGKTYKDATIERVTPAGIDIGYLRQDGAYAMVGIPLSKLTPELQKAFHYDPEKAKAFEEQLEQAKKKTLEEAAEGEAERMARVTREIKARLAGEEVQIKPADLRFAIYARRRPVAVIQVVKANAAYVPPYGSGATLYIRPYMFGINPVIGVKPADEYQFRIFTTPVGPYFKGGAKPITICVSDFDRAAPHGTGHIKAGLNYAMSLHAIVTAHANGFDENMYLDSATRTKVEETGGANFIFVTKDNKVVTPHSSTILPSITRRSIMYVAEHYLGLEVEERDVYFDEVKDFAECGLCGTAAVISPVGKIVNHGEEICLPSGMEKMGPITQKLYDTLTGIQMGHIEAPEGWIKVIE